MASGPCLAEGRSRMSTRKHLTILGGLVQGD